jgi:hypothetical protein
MLKFLSNINYQKIDKFFSEPVNFNTIKSLESHIYENIGSEFISERDRSKLILKSVCLSTDANHTHPARFLMTRLMHVMKNASKDKVLVWMNNLQSHEPYRTEMIRFHRLSGVRPKDAWQTSSFTLWHMPAGKKWTSNRSVLFLPCKNTFSEYAELDLYILQQKTCINMPVKRTKYGLPSFCMYLNFEIFNVCILQGMPAEYQ